MTLRIDAVCNRFRPSNTIILFMIIAMLNFMACTQAVNSPANARSTPGNTAVAVSILAPSRADASQGGSETFGEGNNVLSIGSNVVTGPKSAGNNVVATGGAEVRVNGQRNNVLAVAGETGIVKDAKGDNVVTVCGARVSGQADSIKVSPGGC